jgi:hypothetical protein
MAPLLDSKVRLICATRDWEIAWRRASFSGFGGIGGAGIGESDPLCEGIVTSRGELSRSIGGGAGFSPAVG